MNKLKCIVCGAEYDTCRCSRDIGTFKTIVDSANHYKVYLIVNDFVGGVINKEEALKMLEKCNYSDYKTYLPNIVKVIDRIIEKDVDVIIKDKCVETSKSKKIKKAKF